MLELGDFRARLCRVLLAQMSEFAGRPLGCRLVFSLPVHLVLHIAKAAPHLPRGAVNGQYEFEYQLV